MADGDILVKIDQAMAGLHDIAVIATSCLDVGDQAAWLSALVEIDTMAEAILEHLSANA